MRFGRHRQRSINQLKNKKRPSWPTGLKEDRLGRAQLKLALFLILVLIWSYLLFFSPWFKIKEVVIFGSNPEVTQNIEQSIDQSLARRNYLIIPNDNIFFFHIFDLANLKQKQRLEEITLEKNILDRTIRITYSEKQPALILARDNEQFYLDRDGNEIADVKLEEIDLTSLPLVIWTDGDFQNQIINQQSISAIKKIFERSNDLSLPIASFSVHDSADIPPRPKEEVEPSLSGEENLNEKKLVSSDIQGQADGLGKIKELSAQTGFGWQIYFGGRIFQAQNDLEVQLFNLEAFIKEKLSKSDLGRLQYLDLRFGERVYYK